MATASPILQAAPSATPHKNQPNGPKTRVFAPEFDSFIAVADPRGVLELPPPTEETLRVIASQLRPPKKRKRLAAAARTTVSRLFSSVFVSKALCDFLRYSDFLHIWRTLRPSPDSSGRISLLAKSNPVWKYFFFKIGFFFSSASMPCCCTQVCHGHVGHVSYRS